MLCLATFACRAQDSIVHNVTVLYPNLPGAEHLIDSEAIRTRDILWVPVVWGMKPGDPIIFDHRVYVLKGWYPVYTATDIVEPERKIWRLPELLKDYQRSMSVPFQWRHNR